MLAPPVALAVMIASASPKQVTSVAVAVKTTSSGSPIVIVSDVVHPLSSVTVTS